MSSTQAQDGAEKFRFQTIFLRAYPMPQKTSKRTEYYAQSVLYDTAKRLRNKGAVVRGTLQAGYCEEHGDYLQLKMTRPVRKAQPDMTVWIRV